MVDMNAAKLSDAIRQDIDRTGRFKQALLSLLFAMVFLLPGKAVSGSAMRYQISIGTMVFSDVSDASEHEYQGASLSIPVTFSIRKQRLRWSLGTSYLRQSQNDETHKGMGDTRLSVAFDVNHWLTLGYKHKFATGSESRGFSTGEDDDELYLDFFHALSSSTSLFATTGYKWVGKGDRTDRRNAGRAALGMGYRFSSNFNLLASLDHYQSSYTSSSDINSITAMASYKLNDTLSLSWFVNGDSSDAYSAGTLINYSF
jgi:hypothetical protein